MAFSSCFRRSVLLIPLAVALLPAACQKPGGTRTEPRPAPTATAPTATAPRTSESPSGVSAGKEAEKEVKPKVESEAIRAARKLGTSTKNPVTSTSSGLQYIDVKRGEGAPARAGGTAVVHYTGWLVSGGKFDSSVDRGTPFDFAIGAGQVIRGWDEGVAGMKPGGVRKLIVPPELGYGARGGGPIPPNSTLIFEVELLELR